MLRISSHGSRTCLVQVQCFNILGFGVVVFWLSYFQMLPALVVLSCFRYSLRI
uniref:Uncharacterized protein n=1 Tax=Rhizophora mucronata TaxID=61149 RepID=A0A2P2PEV4_RHIMU